ncbi:MAG TPA: ABC transporter ATP-binding protein [Rhizomicrobium sp.]|jgi:lipoprotein-releasing system ATP-binding protein|nr:ABC transporter ATP-binding protein [Rhizomicrobium sp.]
MNDVPALRLENVARRYVQGEATIEVFRNVSLAVARGELVALVGQSGAGKSSLLHMAGLLEAASDGEIWIDGVAASTLADRERTQLRRDCIGFVYQAHHLLPEFNALENVMMPQLIAGRSKREAAKEARRLLESLGLGQRLTHRPTQLSGGEQQRVAIARALANHPSLLLADEPTGNLDPKTATGVFDALVALVHAEGLAALVATHNVELAAKMDRSLLLHEGQLLVSPSHGPAGET